MVRELGIVAAYLRDEALRVLTSDERLGVLVSEEEVAELARRLRAYGDANGIGVAERLERRLLAGVAIVGTSRPEAEVVLTVIDA